LSTINLTVGDAYTEPGYSSIDAEDGNITGSVVVDTGGLDTDVADTYTITYTSTDSGSLTDVETRTVVVSAAPAQSDSFTVNVGSANIAGGGDKEIKGLTIENTGASTITIDTITVTWSNGQLIEEIKIDNTRIWKHNNEGSPSGRQSTGTEIDVVDFALSSGATVDVTKIKFNGDMSGQTFTILFTFSDASTKLITGLTPADG